MRKLKSLCTKFRCTHVIIFCLVVEIICTSLLAVPFPETEHLQMAMGLENAGWFLDQGICNFVQVMIGIIILYLAGQTVVLKNRGAGFLATLVIGGFLIVYNLAQGIGGLLANQSVSGISIHLADILVFTVSMFLVGMAEELYYRGIMSVALLKKYGTTRKGIWISILIANLIFGLSHIVNVLAGENLGYTITQMISACIGGVLLTAVYFRSGNIWACAFIHAFNDFVLLLSEVVIVGASEEITGELSTGVSFGIGQIVFAIVTQLLPALFILRRSKIGEINKNMSPVLDNMEG